MDRTKYMSLGEVNCLIEATKARAEVDDAYGRQWGPLAWMLVDTALGTGLRVSELARVKVEHFDFSRGALNVVRSKKRKPVPELLAVSAELIEHVRRFTGGRMGFLFLGQRGPLTTSGLQQIWKRAVEKAGLPKMSIHSARHTMAVHLLRRTRNLRHVQKQLGHSSPQITASMYADVSFEDMQAGLENLYGRAS